MLFPLLLGLLFLACYLFLANNLGTRGGLSHGGYLKPRLALLPPLVWLACLREPANMRIRLAFRVLTVALLAVNLFLVMRTFRADNETLERFTAGIDAVGRGQRLTTFGIQRDQPACQPAWRCAPLLLPGDRQPQRLQLRGGHAAFPDQIPPRRAAPTSD